MKKISIIIPIYNAEKYLRECLDSIVNQTLKDIEVVCVNDGSGDNSSIILNEYAQKDSRFIIINQENQGVGAARNKGLEIASGEYIMFVDSDDWIELNACEELYRQISENNDDFVYYGMDLYFQNSGQIKTQDSLGILASYQDSGSFRLSEVETPFVIRGEAVHKIYSKVFLSKNDIKFSDDKIGEDALFYFDCIVNANTVSVLNKCFYHYRQIQTSVTNSSSIDIWEQVFITRDKILKKVLTSDAEHTFLNSALIYSINSILYWYGKWRRSPVFPAKRYYDKMRKYFIRYEKEYAEVLLKYFCSYDYRTFQVILKRSYFGYKVWKVADKLAYLMNIFLLRLMRFVSVKLHIKFVLPFFIVRSCYQNTVKRITKKAKNEKIRVAFYVNDTKWKCQNLFSLMERSGVYEPFVLVGRNNCTVEHRAYQTHEDIRQIYYTFAKNHIPVYYAYDFDKNRHIDLKVFKPDIIFYPSQWCLDRICLIENVFSTCLTCYIPYFISNSPAELESNSVFHNYLWKYFILNNELKEEYQSVMDNKGKNLSVVGYPLLEEYCDYCPEKVAKKYVIYAPHWSLGETPLKYATFDWNGRFILEFAKQHPEINWIFKPHPLLKSRLVELGYMTQSEVEAYWQAWAELGFKYEGADYLHLFKESRALITDCGSFLAEYMPTESPVILLCSPTATPYNFLAQKVTEFYYKARNLKDLQTLLKSVILEKEDPLKAERVKRLIELKLVTCASERIIDVFNKEFKFAQNGLIKQ